jgi:hypothetical protein
MLLHEGVSLSFDQLLSSIKARLEPCHLFPQALILHRHGINLRAALPALQCF